MEENTFENEFKTTSDVKIPDNLIDQIIGQNESIEIVKLAIQNRRNILLLGAPGIGKSMIGKSYSELLEKTNRDEIFSFFNEENQNNPLISSVPSDKGTELYNEHLKQAKQKNKFKKLFWVLFELFVFTVIISNLFINFDIMVFLFSILVLTVFEIYNPKNKIQNINSLPNRLISGLLSEKPPFIDATGVSKSTLLGDVKHDPYQSGGLETSPHLRLVPGLIHLANKGVLYIDEIGTLDYDTQISILTALQNKKFPIKGRSEGSSGASVQSEDIPCDFSLVAAGNIETLSMLHPALKSRFQGNGYIVYLNDETINSKNFFENFLQFVAQETKEENGYHFDRSGVKELLNISYMWARVPNNVSLRFRDLSGIVKISNDVLKSYNSINELENLNEQKSLLITENEVSKAFGLHYLNRIVKSNQIQNSSNKRIFSFTGNLFDLKLLNVYVTKMNINSEKFIKVKLNKNLKEIKNKIQMLFNEINLLKSIPNDVYFVNIETKDELITDGYEFALVGSLISCVTGIDFNKNIAAIGKIDTNFNFLIDDFSILKIRLGIELGIKSFILPNELSKYVNILNFLTKDIEIRYCSTLDDFLNLFN